ncbi:MAG: sensor histidine kinase [Candidatus Lokiarchaeota archaeon]|nr:sensor histidine kinase [Candidatus Lokiarchaeota archaeon]
MNEPIDSSSENIINLESSKSLLDVLFHDSNLLIALYNTPSGGEIFIGTKHKENYIDVFVKDTGVGMIEKEKLNLFQAFGKIERYGKGLDVFIDGVGLGLYTSKQILKKTRR